MRISDSPRYIITVHTYWKREHNGDVGVKGDLSKLEAHVKDCDVWG